MNINILGGGPQEFIPDLEKYQEGEGAVWIGVDHGVFRLLRRGITPDMAFGDFDSVNEEEWKLIEEKVKKINRFMPEKNETDMELALSWAIGKSPDIIRIFGATGGRIDHFLANIQLLGKKEILHPGIEIEIIDIQNHVQIVPPGEYTLAEKKQSKYVSFLPLSASVEGLTLQGFKYPLENRNITLGSTLCISNELIQPTGTFSFLSGILMVIRSHD
ncbi:thiamine diphosphokinase [Rossellomorea vietnamensis]|uniref:Thiamine diphosphokinase n=1 Tax=Rossellomorea vietnamensis TaxID=218284 RepID=A0A5D4NQZ2_9BACI|nr:thiamine diphosphokinase [Rossellomorea vietnamensis]TYS16329.1 thiamine diphosphokinase [Rossellomorea vietnamensis]